MLARTGHTEKSSEARPSSRKVTTQGPHSHPMMATSGTCGTRGTRGTRVAQVAHVVAGGHGQTLKDDQIECRRDLESLPSVQANAMDLLHVPHKKGAPDGDVDEGVHFPASQRVMLVSAKRGRLQGVKDAVAGGVDINSKTHEGDTALMLAAQAGHAWVVDWLITAGATLNARNPGGESALSLAARAGHVDVARRLRTAGGIIPIMKFDEGLKALRKAIAANAHAEAIGWMIAGLTPGHMYPCLVHELQPSFKGAEEESRCAAAARRALLVCRTEYASVPPLALHIQLSLDTHMVRAAAEQRLELVLALRAEGANLPERCLDVARDALIEDARLGRTAGAQAWLAAGVAVNEGDEHQRTALMYAAISDDTELLNTFIKEGAELDLRDKDGHTALNYAAKAGNASTTDLLLQKGASMGLADKQGRLPIDWAARGCHLKVLTALVRNGATFTVEHMRYITWGLAIRLENSLIRAEDDALPQDPLLKPGRS